MSDAQSHVRLLREHYQRQWGSSPAARRWRSGPIQQLGAEFQVLEFPPTDHSFMWIYSTAGMTPTVDALHQRLELHLFAPQPDESLVELLTMIAHYHVTEKPLGLHHTVNFGRPWLAGSACDHGFISLPYPYGPSLEWLAPGNQEQTRCLWLIPITRGEVAFKKSHGPEALESRFEERQFNYLDPRRPGVC
jgi:hypothetical protein